MSCSDWDTTRLLRVDCDRGDELVGCTHAPDSAVTAAQHDSRPPSSLGSQRLKFVLACLMRGAERLSADGCLETQDGTWVQNHRRKHAELFDLCDSLSRQTLSFLLDLHVRNRDKRQLLTSSLLARSFQVHLTCLQSTERGLDAPSDVLLRALLEVVFTICAIARSPDVLERYITDDDIQRLKLLHAIRATKSPNLAFGRAAATDELRNELKAKVKLGAPTPVDVEELARRAGLHDWYVGIYRVLSQTAHATVRDIERYFVLNDTGDEIEALRLTPSDAETPRLLKTAGSFLLTALNAAGFIFDIDFSAASERYKGTFDNGFSKP